MTRTLTVLFWFSSLAIALLSLRALLLPVNLAMPNMVHYETLVPIAFWAHVIGGPVALALAPMQLWAGFRVRHRTLHRWVGRGYGVAILAGGVGSLVFVPNFLGSSGAALGFAVLAVLWIGFTGLGILRAMQGDIIAHRRWMLRSVALTFAAVTLRLMMPVLMAAGWTLLETYDVTAWMCWLPNLVIAEWWLRRDRSRLPAAT